MITDDPGKKTYCELVDGYIFDAGNRSYSKITCSDDRKRIPFDEIITLNGGKLELKLASCVQPMELIEEVRVCAPYDMPVAEEHLIGECLQAWQLGTVEHSIDSNDIWIEISTNKHSYIFVSNPNQLYCRAARLRSNEHGSVFAQNIRIMFSSYGNQKTVDMPADNYVLSKKDILIDNSLFIPDACAFEDDGIYWAVYYKIEWLR